MMCGTSLTRRLDHTSIFRPMCTEIDMTSIEIFQIRTINILIHIIEIYGGRYMQTSKGDETGRGKEGCVPMFPSPYIPQSLCSPAPMFPSPDVPGPYIPQSYVPQSLSSPTRYTLCYPVPVFPSPFASQSRCSPNVFPVPMFPKDISQSLCFPVPLLHSPFVSTVNIMFPGVHRDWGT